MEAMLTDARRSPRERLVAAVRRFFETEAEEAELRNALQVAERLFWELPEFQAIQARAERDVQAFLRDAVGVPSRRLAFETQLVLATVAGLAERVTREPPGPAALRRWADAASGMLCTRLGL